MTCKQGPAYITISGRYVPMTAESMHHSRDIASIGQALMLLEMRTSRVFYNTQCVQCHWTIKLSATAARNAIGWLEYAPQADKQCQHHTKVAVCNNKHTVHIAAHKLRQQLDDNLATTYQLDAYIPHCSICCQP